MTAYLAEHFVREISLTTLAEKVHLSRSRLCHLFKEQTGESITDTLAKMRLHQAARLLEFTSMNISEIAQEVGFRSAYYFTSRFTDFYGMNPTTFRKQVRSDLPRPQKSPSSTSDPV